MLISSIGYKNTYPVSINKSQQNKSFTLKHDTVNFTGINHLEIPHKLFSNPINKFSDFSIDEYKKLSCREIKFLRFLYKNCVKIFDGDFYDEAEMLHEKTASTLKCTLDERFGKNGYVFIPIGRSLSSIGKVLGYKIGEESVKNIPMSCVHRFALCDLDKNIVKQTGKYKLLNEYIGYKDNIDVFSDYLNSIGLSKDVIDSSGKNYVISDYSFTGTSMKGIKNLFRFDGIFGKKDNIFIESIMDLIPKDSFDSFNRLRLDYNLSNALYKRFSFVEQSLYLNETAKHIKDLKSEKLSTKLFWFKLLDNEMSKR